jgi:hypothetical protein
MSEIFAASTADLLDIAARNEESHWQIAIWPVLATEVFCSDAAEVATTKAVVLWKQLVKVHADSNELVIETASTTFRPAPGHRTFVIREAS